MQDSKAKFDNKKIKILIVDDHDLIRKSIIKILSKKKFEQFIECSNGLEALEILKTKPIDLVFCDLYLPKLSGLELLQSIRSRSTNYDIPFIVVSGEANKDDIVKAVDIGAEAYLLKPFQTADVEKQTAEVLKNYFSPTPLVHYSRKAEKFLMARDYQKAQLAVDKALELDSNSARANHVNAAIAFEQGDCQNAINILNSNIQNNRNFLKNYTLLADIYLSIGAVENAIETLESELALNPKNARRQVKIAKLYFNQKLYDNAKEHYRQALLVNGKLKLALLGMGLAYGDSGNTEKAIYYFKRARRHHPEMTKSLEAIVKYALEADKPRLAEMALRDEKKNYPKRIDTYLVLAKLYKTCNREEEAITTLEQGLMYSPDDVDILSLKGIIEYHQKLLERAEKTFRRLVTITQSFQFSLNLAEVLIERKKYSQAIEILNQCLQNPNTRPKILSAIAASSAKTQQVTKAYYAYKSASNLSRNGKSNDTEMLRLSNIILDRRTKKVV